MQVQYQPAPRQRQQTGTQYRTNNFNSNYNRDYDIWSAKNGPIRLIFLLIFPESSIG